MSVNLKFRTWLLCWYQVAWVDYIVSDCGASFFHVIVCYWCSLYMFMCVHWCRGKWKQTSVSLMLFPSDLMIYVATNWGLWAESMIRWGERIEGIHNCVSDCVCVSVCVCVCVYVCVCARVCALHSLWLALFSDSSPSSCTQHIATMWNRCDRPAGHTHQPHLLTPRYNNSRQMTTTTIMTTMIPIVTPTTTGHIGTCSEHCPVWQK